MSMTRRRFLSNAAAVAAPALLPSSLFAAPDPLGRIDAYWAEYFGCSVRDLHGDRTLVLPHKALARFDGVYVFRHGASCIVSVPHHVPEIERSQLRSADPAKVFDPGFLSRVFQVRRDRIHDPYELGFADRADFPKIAPRTLLRGDKNIETRLLGSDRDKMALDLLAHFCRDPRWQRSCRSRFQGSMVGLFSSGTLVAASGYEAIQHCIAAIDAIVDLDWHGLGLRRRVVHAAMKDALDKGLVPFWCTPLRDARDVAGSRSLGFRPYATTMSVQLQEDEF
jgi:hypothetical protein